MNKQFAMLSGLPRSGSTVLASMLNQHPDIHTTTTSPVADLFVIIQENWPVISQAVVDPDARQYANIITSMIDGAHAHIDRPVIIDKNRLWPRYSELLHYALDEKPKIICTVRKIPDILASYILLLEKNPGHQFVDSDLIQMNLPLTLKNRCRILWEKYTFHPYTSLKIGLKSNHADMLFVDYEDITTNPQLTIDNICDFLSIDRFNVATTDLKPMRENDEYHGGLKGLHDVRPELKKTSPTPEKVIGHDLVKLYTDMKLEFWKNI